TDRKVGDEDELAFLDPLRKRGLERVLLLLRVHLVGVVAGLRTEDRSTVTMDRRTVAALARAAGALLPERLLARAAHFRPGLRLVCSLTQRSEVVANRFGNQMLFVRLRENLVSEIRRAGL